MNLLIDAHCFDYETSEGINTYIKGLYKALISNTEDIDFYFVTKNIEKLRKIFGEKKNIHYISFKSKNKFRRFFFDYPKIIKDYKIDIAHFQYIIPFNIKCKTIDTLHDILFLDYPQYFPFFYKLIKGFFFKKSAKKADLLLTVSNYSRDRISFHYNIKGDKILVTPNAVSSDFIDIDMVEAQEFIKRKGLNKYVLYVSRIEPRKNHLALVKSYCDLRLWEKDYHLVCIGRESIQVPELEEYISNLNIDVKNFIHFIDQVSYDDLKLWYKGASLFVYPSLFEGFGIPPIEAAAAGIPCVCSNATAMSDFNFFGNNLIDINDKQILNNTIIDTLNKPYDTSAIRVLIMEKYNWDVSAKVFYEGLKQIKQ